MLVTTLKDSKTSKHVFTYFVSVVNKYLPLLKFQPSYVILEVKPNLFLLFRKATTLKVENSFIIQNTILIFVVRILFLKKCKEICVTWRGGGVALL